MGGVAVSGSETLLVRENVLIEVCHLPTGRVWRQRVHNIVTDVELTRAGALLGAGANPLTDVAVGTDNTTPTAADTILGAELHRAAISQTLVQAQQSVRRYFLPSSAANGVTLYEAGIFTSDNVLFSRVVHDEIEKTALLTVTYTWTHGMARAS